MMHVVAGLFSIALGIWGVFDEWYYVVNFLKGAGSLLLTVAGILSMLAGSVPGTPRTGWADWQSETPPTEDDDNGSRA